MPELPEVETTRQGLAPHLIGRTIVTAVCRVAKLRLPLDPALPQLLIGQTVTALERRGKYLLLRCTGGTLLIHLGMTGHLRLFAPDVPAAKFDHFELTLSDGRIMRLSDPRKFGTIVWTETDPLRHPLLSGSGPEPLEDAFNGACLYQQTRRRGAAIKLVLMDNRVVVGVGNIYANETCFRLRLNPATPARELSQAQCDHVATTVREVLQEAIAMGGTTLRDYVDSEGKPGYFRLVLAVYGREGKPCLTCGNTIKRSVLSGRSTFWCPVCQKQ
jgi:formamidopyrimidine-DNA glycosylase